MLLSVIIVSYNTAGLTVQTVESVLNEIKISTLLKGQADIWIVDNNSSDESVSLLKVLAKKSSTPITIIENQDNTGFSGANNQAITQSKGEYVLLLNSDTLVKPGALEHLLRIYQAQPSSEVTAGLSSHHNQLDRLGILSCELLNPDGSEQRQGGSFPSLLSLAAQMLFLDDLPVIGNWLPSTQHTGKNVRLASHETAQLEPKDWVAGTVMMIKREVFDEIGLLDDQIFMYGEDIEFCLRAAHHHWDAAIDHQAQITHYGSASSSSQNALIGELKAYRYIWSKHKPLWQIPLVRVILILGCLLRILVFGTISGNKQKANAYQLALKYL